MTKNNAAKAAEQAIKAAIRKAYDDGYNDAKMAPDNCSTYCVERAVRLDSAALQSALRAPVADESPMAKMADALREKARQEQQTYQDRRAQATEWGPLPEGTEADLLTRNAPVAHVAGDETSRYLDWAKDRSAWEMPVGTPVYYSALASAPVAGEAQQADDTLKQVYDWFGIGVMARNQSTLMACLGNVIRRANCLSQIERVLSVPTPPEPEDDGVWGEESLLRWGADEKGYAEHFKAALAEWSRRTPMSEEPVYAYRRKGLDDFVTCNRQRFDELSAKPRLFETRIFYAAPQASEAVRILFPTYLRKMWSGGEVQAWLDEHQGVTPPKVSAKGSLERYRKWQAEREEAFGAGVKAAADLVKKMVDDYDTDHGSTDPETGTREYPGDGAAWVCDMEELEGSIRALSAQPAQKEGGSDAN